LNNLLGLFWNNLFPIFLIAGLGYLIGRWKKISPKPLAQVVFYIFSPALIYDIIAHSELSSTDILKVGSITILSTIILTGLAYIAGKILRLDRKLSAALILVSILPNAGNYGLSVNLLTFGDDALAYASIYFSFSVIVMFTLGVFIASMGSTSIQGSIKSLLKVPSIYAVIIAFTFLAYNLHFPSPVEHAITILSDATIPAMLVLLGLQFQQITPNNHLGALASGTVLRLLISPLLGFGLASLFNLQGAVLQAVVTESAMPSAVTNTVLATEYDVEPAFVASVVFFTTILSPFTITPLLAFLR
jgi:malate permease and related proteins